MTKWTKPVVFLTIFTVLLSTTLARWLASANIYMLFFVPLVCTAPLAWLLKKRGRRLRFFAVLLAAFDVLLLAGAANLNVTTQIVHILTGYYNAEAVAFSLLIPLLCGWGMLAGVGLGALLANLGGRMQ